RGAAGQGAAVELARRHQRRFDVKMRVDETRDADRVAAVDLDAAAISLIGADNAVAADRDVARRDLAGHHIEEARVLDDQIGVVAAERLVDSARDGGNVPGHRALWHGAALT